MITIGRSSLVSHHNTFVEVSVLHPANKAKELLLHATLLWFVEHDCASSHLPCLRNHLGLDFLLIFGFPIIPQDADLLEGARRNSAVAKEALSKLGFVEEFLGGTCMDRRRKCL